MAHFAGTRKLAFVIRSSKIQGKGAFATRRILKGARIIEYLGECIDEDEADIRYPDDEMGRHHTFLFAIGDGTRVLDAGPLDWPAKYINHSCDPNCEAVEEEDGRVFIGALRNIPKGTELLYDYAYERTPEHTEADEKLYACRCGSPKCRGTIMAPPKVKKDRKAKQKAKKKSDRKSEKKSDRKSEKQSEKNSDRKSEKQPGKQSDGKKELRKAAKQGKQVSA
ncbi:MAG: SET domain-containing protein-lysine N-methyltransferase [Gemmatimonadaceae bacterium]|nr:SET domain-containing protein-lysine N-methyltransferase [Gemmatimonadaceae bacterium]